MYRVIRGNKYGAKKHDYNGVIYHSKKEAGYAQELDLRVRANDIIKWERQYKVSIDINGYHICNYYVDFLVYHHNGDLELVEVKGFYTEVYRMKAKLLEAVFLEEHKEFIYTVIT